ncbi:Lipase 1 [Eumeta japonica]|uniref:Lipase n=1 Tax=Eumeta variegata TaxID=151549 RepID=A0A4C1YXF6_EUMVA|nr:Lipase 1 [Eumeta japonica]
MAVFTFVLLVLVLCFKTTTALLGDDNVAIPYAEPSSEIENAILIEDARLNFTQLAGKYGYLVEEHTVVTEDKYKLKVFHITGKGRCNGTKYSRPVVLQHGLLDSADTWLLAGPDAGLAYGLTDACYDVWCASVRGDCYSRAHETLDPDHDAQFWNFAFEEYGEIDLPSIIDYVIEQTDSEDVFYVGHSQGTSDFLIMTSTQEDYNDRIRLAILLAPIASLKHLKSKLLRLLAAGSPVLYEALNLTDVREIFGRKQPPHKIAAVLCTLVPEVACTVPIMALAGDSTNGISRKTKQILGDHYFCGSSTKNVVQCGQYVNTGRFARYDYGKEENLELYGVHPPPEFDLSRVRTPVVLVVAQSDKLSVIADVNLINATLPNVLEYYVVPKPDWGHASLVWNSELPVYVNSKIINYFNKYSDKANPLQN